MDKLFLIEGIPGAGKTTFAKVLADNLSECGEVSLFVEGDLHPADMAWCALLSNSEFDKLCDEYPQYKADFEQNSTCWKDSRIVAYTKVPQLDGELFSYFESKEVYDNRVSTDVFCGVHRVRWESFGKTASGINIFECAFLQNSINELLLFHEASLDEITNYLAELLKATERLSPEIIYLDVDTDKALDIVAAERVDESGERVWESRVMEYITQSSYGKAHDLSGIDGMRRYFRDRRLLELEILGKLQVKSTVIKIDLHDGEQRAKCVNAAVAALKGSLV